MDVSGQLHVPSAFHPKKEPPVPIGYEAGWAPEAVMTLWGKEKSLVLTGNRTPPVQAIARRCTKTILIYFYLFMFC
jgi:hypothetical protein